MIKKIKSFLFENKTDKQTIIKNTFWLMLAEGVSKGGMFFITILIARLLGPEQFGILSFVMSFVAMFIVITDFGLTTLMVREVSRDHSKIQDYLINLSFLKVALGIITFLLVLIVSQFIGKDSFYTTLILIYAGYAIMNNFGEFIRAFFRPSEKMQYEALLKIINGILMLGIVLGALFYYGDLKSIIYGYLLAGILSFIISLIYVGRKFEVGKLKLNKEVIRSSLKSGIYLMGGMLAVNMFNYIDQIMIGFIRTEEELGYYSSAYRIVGVIILLAVLFINVIFPKLTKLIDNNVKLNSFIKKINNQIFIFSFIFIVISYFYSENIISILYGEKYLQASYTYFILSISVLIILLNNIYGNLLIIRKKEKIFFMVVFFSLFINIILNYIYIPIYGINSAAFVTLLTESIVLICYYIYNLILYSNSN